MFLALAYSVAWPESAHPRFGAAPGKSIVPAIQALRKLPRPLLSPLGNSDHALRACDSSIRHYFDHAPEKDTPKRISISTVSTPTAGLGLSEWKTRESGVHHRSWHRCVGNHPPMRVGHCLEMRPFRERDACQKTVKTLLCSELPPETGDGPRTHYLEKMWAPVGVVDTSFA